MLTTVLLLLFAAGVVLALSQLQRRELPHRRLTLGRLSRGVALLRDERGALLPGAGTTVGEGGGGKGPNSNLICVMSCMQLGTPNQLGLFDDAGELLGEYGLGEGGEFVAHYMPATQNPVLFESLEVATAGTLGNVDITGVLGTSEVTFTGTPLDDEEIAVLVADDGNNGEGGTVGTTGIVIQTSRDGGRTYGRRIRLGTATSYLIPNTGITVNFGAGTLLGAVNGVGGDVARCVATSPKWDAAALTAAFTELVNSTFQPRVVLVCGDCQDGTHLQDVIAQAAAITGVNRFAQIVCSLRDYLPKAVFQGSNVVTAQLAGQTVTAAAAGKTYTRSAGSWLTDGFVVGDTVNFAGFTNAGNNGHQIITTLTATIMTCAASALVDEGPVMNVTCSTAGGGEEITVASAGGTYTRSGGSWLTEGFQVGMTATFTGFTNAGNNGPKVISAVSALVLTTTTVAGLVNEGPLAGVGCTAVETDPQWQTALAAMVGTTPATELINNRVCPYGGRARRVSPTDGSMKRRPATWPMLMRWMAHDPQIAPYRTADKGLDGWTITDANGRPEDHDERTMGGLLANRISCLRTYQEVDLPGVYVALSLTLDQDDSPLSRMQISAVSDIIATIVQSETALKIGLDLDPNADGTPTEAQARAIEDAVLERVKNAVLTPGVNDKRPAASQVVSVTISRSVDLSVEGATVPTETDWVPRGYLEKITNKVLVQTGS